MLCQRFKRRIRQCGPERLYGRASDIYQGGETEPLMLTETVLAADKSLDTEFAKSYSQVLALNVRAYVTKQTHQ